jgi:hypothetical protein
MKKHSFLDSIEVKSPCMQDWDSMHGNDEMRFCDHCVKHVHNLSALTRKDARKLIVRSQGGICVRYIRRPDGRIETLKQKLHQITRQTGLAAGVLGASLSVSTLAYGQADTADTQGNPAAAELQVKKNNAPGGTISGVITDQNGAVITFAIVTVFNEAAAFYQSAPTNMEGAYEFKNLPEGKYKLKVDAAGFDSREAGEIAVSPEDNVRRDVQLSVLEFRQTVEVGGDKDKTEGITWTGIVSCDPETFTIKNKLIRAVRDDNTEEVKRLIGMGKKVNVKNTDSDGNFPLHFAVENGNIELVQLLLNAGAKISVKNYEKRTPLMMLDGDATSELINLLLRFGAAVGAVDKNKNTALILAAGDASEEVVRVLLLNGANVNAQNKKGRTALMRAADEGNLENVRALLESGADVNLRGAAGETAWDLATGEDIKNLLISFGATAQKP